MGRILSQDEVLVWNYLAGNLLPSTEKSGVTEPAKREYVKENSDDEKAARRLLAEMLRGSKPLSGDMRNLLADLVDVEESYNPRQIKLEFRRPGAPTNVDGDSEIVFFILERVNSGLPQKAAIADASEKYDRSKAATYGLWKRKRPVLEAAGMLERRRPGKG